MADNLELRKAFGSFLTGVTVLTALSADGVPRGFTANSFTSVSLEPPLLLVCISRHAASCGVFREARSFAVNILAEDQTEISNLFATKSAEKFKIAAWRHGDNGCPLLEGSLAWFECRRHDLVEAGDHHILIGEIGSYGTRPAAGPLAYHKGSYVEIATALSEVG